eukprot:gene18283-48244_t
MELERMQHAQDADIHDLQRAQTDALPTAGRGGSPPLERSRTGTGALNGDARGGSPLARSATGLQGPSAGWVFSIAALFDAVVALRGRGRGGDASTAELPGTKRAK